MNVEKAEVYVDSKGERWQFYLIENDVLLAITNNFKPPISDWQIHHSISERKNILINEIERSLKY